MVAPGVIRDGAIGDLLGLPRYELVVMPAGQIARASRTFGTRPAEGYNSVRYARRPTRGARSVGMKPTFILQFTVT